MYLSIEREKIQEYRNWIHDQLTGKIPAIYPRPKLEDALLDYDEILLGNNPPNINVI